MVSPFSRPAICCGFVFLNLNPVTVTFSGDSRYSCFTSANRRAALVSKGQAGAEIQSCHMLSNIVLCLPVLGEGRRPESAAQPASEDVGTLQDSKSRVWRSYCCSKLTSGCSNTHCLFCCPQWQESCHLLLAYQTVPALRGVISEARFKKQSKLGQKKNNEWGCQNTVKDHVMALSAHLKPRKAENLIRDQREEFKIKKVPTINFKLWEGNSNICIFLKNSPVFWYFHWQK